MPTYFVEMKLTADQADHMVLIFEQAKVKVKGRGIGTAASPEHRWFEVSVKAKSVLQAVYQGDKRTRAMLVQVREIDSGEGKDQARQLALF